MFMIFGRKHQEIIENQKRTIDTLENILRDQQIHFDELSQHIQHVSRNNDKYSEEYHRQIDFLYRDIMMMLKGDSGHWSEEADLHTDYPIAFDSNDTMFPHGTVRDNTRCPRFIRKCEKVLGRDKDLRFLDLGCSGGGTVLDALLYGHYGLGLEGCDISERQQRAEWRLIPEHLKTCDISRPFSITVPDSGEPMLFDVVTAWEVLEHIPEDRLNQLFDNISKCLKNNGIFVASIANCPDIDPVTGTNWHVTMHPRNWWTNKLEGFGFELCEGLFDVEDYARGRYNPHNCYEKVPENGYEDNEENFHVVVRKKQI